MSNLETFYPEVRIGGFTDVDGTIVFFTRVNSLLDPSFVVLDVGCGRGEYQEDPVPFRRNLRNLKGKVAKVIGLDVDPKAQGNPFLDEFHLLQSDSWPVEANSIDLMVCDHALEHVSNPDQLFLETRRVLKNSGHLCIRTPNRWSYISIAARLLPSRYHAKVTSAVQSGRREEDVFPTLYRCNTVGKIKKMMKKTGFECAVYGYEPEPRYLSFSKAAYYCGVLHQRFAPRFLKPVIFAFGRRTKDIAI
jgi:SAM-dependent methyltransferase